MKMNWSEVDQILKGALEIGRLSREESFPNEFHWVYAIGSEPNIWWCRSPQMDMKFVFNMMQLRREYEVARQSGAVCEEPQNETKEVERPEADFGGYDGG